MAAQGLKGIRGVSWFTVTSTQEKQATRLCNARDNADMLCYLVRTRRTSNEEIMLYRFAFLRLTSVTRVAKRRRQHLYLLLVIAVVILTRYSFFDELLRRVEDWNHASRGARPKVSGYGDACKSLC
jgi:hypothetical protein